MAGQAAYHLMAQAGMTRAPWAITTVVSCLPVLVLGMGTALAHMLRTGAEAADAPDSQTGPPAAPRSLPWSAEDQDRPGRMRPETDQARSPSRDQHGETPGPQHGGDVGATATDVRASLSEVVTALAALTGEPHPLATAEGW